MLVKSALVILAVGLVCFSSACGSSNTGSSSTHQSSTRRPPQNDDYISTYGEQASGPDRQAIVKLVQRYYAAAVADDGAAACPLIYSTLEKSIPEDYGQPPAPPTTRGKTCPVVMSKFFRHLPRQPVSGLASTKVTGVRIHGDHAFVQLSSKAIPTGEISVQHEAQGWKIQTLIGEACKNCAAS
jgi:hypothetical protein